MGKNADRKLQRYGTIPTADRDQLARERLFHSCSAAPDGLRREYINTMVAHVRGEGAAIQGKDHGRDMRHQPRYPRVVRMVAQVKPMEGQHFSRPQANIRWQRIEDDK